MAWGKTEQQKEQERELRDAQLKDQQSATYAGLVGQATSAHKNGDRFLQLHLRVGEVANGHISLPKSGIQIAERASAILGEIEAAGWRLEHTGFVFAETGAWFTLQKTNTDTSGEVMGIYLFRRVDRDL
jgi:hypothetical protein